MKFLVINGVNLNLTGKREKGVYGSASLEEINEKIAIILKKVGVSPSNLGWKYLTEAIKMVIDDANVIDGITKRLYPAIAEKYNSNSRAVERAIRHFVCKAFKNMPSETRFFIFGNTVLNKDFPTNSEFITTLAEIVTSEPNNPIWTMQIKEKDDEQR
jgi:two-component system response regulator (stage 0 sporulation protein A)